MSYYTLVRRETRIRHGVRYKVEVWRGFQGCVADILPMGSNEPIAKRYAKTPTRAWQLALNSPSGKWRCLSGRWRLTFSSVSEVPTNGDHLDAEPSL